MKIIRKYAPERLVYVDEAGIDNTLDYPYGYCHKSQRYMSEKLGHKTERLSMISGFREGEIIAPMVFDGYCNSKLFCQWISQCLVPELLPGQIVIMDNASFHPVAKIKELLKPARCEVIFLPPYSPDLNKIEKFWARLKNYVSQILSQCQNLSVAVREAFLQLS